MHLDQNIDDGLRHPLARPEMQLEVAAIGGHDLDFHRPRVEGRAQAMAPVGCAVRQAEAQIGEFEIVDIVQCQLRFERLV
jgi:hypothetical protein